MRQAVRIFILVFSLLLGSNSAFCQAYITMPTDSASWRYRLWDYDFITTVTDLLLFNNGQDTVANGQTYQVIKARSAIRSGGAGFNPPVTDIMANRPDSYFGAIREQAKKVYELVGTSEKLIYNFNANVGDSIPCFTSRVRVAVIDSVLLGGVYHKRYLTSDTGYYVIEGVGSSRGLLPDFIGPVSNDQFFCFADTPVTFTPNGLFPCTHVWGINVFGDGVAAFTPPGGYSVFPNPADGYLYITAGNVVPDYVVFIVPGKIIYTGDSNTGGSIDTHNWEPGYYFIYIHEKGQAGQVIPVIINR